MPPASKEGGKEGGKEGRRLFILWQTLVHSLTHSLTHSLIAIPGERETEEGGEQNGTNRTRRVFFKTEAKNTSRIHVHVHVDVFSPFNGGFLHISVSPTRETRQV